MLILLIEDDPVQAELMEKAIGERLGVETFRIATEWDFLAGLDDIAQRAPGAIVIDVMLRWADPAEQMPPTPVDYKKVGGYRRAGLRCKKKLMEDPRTRAIPIILYTVLPRESLHLGASDLAYVQKGNGFDELLQRLQLYAARR